MILLECQNLKTFLQKAIFYTSLSKFSWLKKLKTLYLGHVISGLKVEQIVGMFYKQELHKVNQKVIKRKGNNHTLNGKATIVLLTVVLIKKHIINKWIFTATKIFRRKSES